MPKINGPHRKMLSVRVDPVLLGRAQAMATHARRGLTELVEEGLRKVLPTYEREARREGEAREGTEGTTHPTPHPLESR